MVPWPRPRVPQSVQTLRRCNAAPLNALPAMTPRRTATRTIHDRLSEAKNRVCVTPHEHQQRIDELKSLTKEFVDRTTTAAVELARSFHFVRREASDDDSQAALAEAMSEMRPDGSLRLVSDGFAGGVKAIDTKNEAFFKISMDRSGIYGGSRVMSGKAAKHELSALRLLHEIVDGVHLTVPLASCVDVTVPDGELRHVYRVQALSLLPISVSTLRTGSSDGGLSTHICEAMIAPLVSVADAFHLAPTPVFCSLDRVTVHSYDADVASTRHATSALAGAEPALTAVLDELGVQVGAAAVSGPCRELESSVPAACHVVLDPFRTVSSRYSHASASEVGVPHWATGPDRCCQQLLPFDVEGHMMASGERCIVDAHRLCIPEVHPPREASGCVAIVMRGGAMVNVVECPGVVDWTSSSLDHSLASTAALAAEIRPHDGFSVCSASGSGCVTVSWAGADVAVILSHPALYWETTRLTALFPPTAGRVLREAGVPRMSPDTAMIGRNCVGLCPAALELLSAENLVSAEAKVRVHVHRCREDASEDIISLRAAVKAGLHASGLGLRHVWRLWRCLDDHHRTDSSAAAKNRDTAPAPVLECALVCACLPRPGSSAALALESLVTDVERTHPGARAQVLVACLAGRSAAAKGLGLDAASRSKLCERLLSSRTAERVMKSWRRLQSRALVSVKASGLGGQRHSGLSAGSPGAATRGPAATPEQAQLIELGHRQRCGNERGELAMLTQIGALAHRSLASTERGQLAMIRAIVLASETPAEMDQVDRLGLLLSRCGQQTAALWAHNLALNLRTKQLGESHQEVARSWRSIGICQTLLGQHDDAFDSQNRGLRIQLASIGESHPDVAASWSSIGECCLAAGDYEGGLDAHRRSLELRRASLKSTDPDIGASWANIGDCHLVTAKYGLALEAHQRGLRNRQESLGPRHPDVASSFCKIGGCMLRLARFAEALDAHQEGLDIRRLAFGANPHPDVAESESGIGDCHLAAGRHEAAMTSYQRAFAIRTKSLGSSHPDVGSTWSSIGACHLARGRLGMALEAYEQGLEVRRAALGDNHPEVGASWSDIGSARWAQGAYAKALEEHERGLQIKMASLGKSHFEVGSSWSSIGSCHLRMGRHQDALKAHERGLRILVSALGESHPTAGSCWASIGECCIGAGEFEGAKRALDQGLEIQRAALGEDHPRFGATCVNAGACMSRMGDHDEAMRALRKGLAVQRAALGEEHSEVGAAWTTIGTCRARMGEHTSALEAYETGLAIQRRALGDDHPEVGITCRLIGNCRLSMGDEGRALVALEEGLAIQRAALGDDHPEAGITWAALGMCRYKTGDFAGALEPLERGLAAQRAALGDDHPEAGITWAALGMCRYETGDFAGWGSGAP